MIKLTLVIQDYELQGMINNYDVYTLQLLHHYEFVLKSME